MGISGLGFLGHAVALSIVPTLEPNSRRLAKAQQQLIQHHALDHRLNDRDAANGHTGVMTAFGYNVHAFAETV